MVSKLSSQLASVVLVLVGVALWASQNPQVQAVLSDLSSEISRFIGVNAIEVIGLAIAAVGVFFLGRSSRA